MPWYWTSPKYLFESPGVGQQSQEQTDGIHPIWESERKIRPNSYTVASVIDDPSTEEMINKCSILYFKEPPCFEFPQIKQPIFQYKDLLGEPRV